MFIRPTIFDSKKVIAAQSNRLNGLSEEPFGTLNLGLSVNDDEQLVLKNRELFFGSIGVQLNQLAISYQIHGSKVLTINEPSQTQGYDAQITNKPTVFLVVSVADCTPILIHDTKNNAVAAIHAGWKGTAGKIVSNTLLEMQKQYGTIGVNCKAFIGACIGYANFEVNEDVAKHFDASLKRFDTQKQKWFVDLKSANKQQLLNDCVLAENIEVSDYCTVTNNDLFFSHRKENGITGRMMAVIGIKK